MGADNKNQSSSKKQATRKILFFPKNSKTPKNPNEFSVLTLLGGGNRQGVGSGKEKGTGVRDHCAFKGKLRNQWESEHEIADHDNYF